MGTKRQASLSWFFTGNAGNINTHSTGNKTTPNHATGESTNQHSGDNKSEMKPVRHLDGAHNGNKLSMETLHNSSAHCNYLSSVTDSDTNPPSRKRRLDDDDDDDDGNDEDHAGGDGNATAYGSEGNVAVAAAGAAGGAQVGVNEAGSAAKRQKGLSQKLTLAHSQEAGRRQQMAEPGVDAPLNKPTPLEKQVIEFKQKYPDVLLMFEVGYKLRFFGRDAECAADALGVMCFPDRNFLTASVPTVRANYYVRRLVLSGYKVGVIGQAETAAVKAQGPNKQNLFERKLTALHTRATLDAGEGQGVSESPPGSAGDPKSVSSRLVCIVEGNGSGKHVAYISVIGVDTSTGDVVHTHFEDSQMRSGLESTLICLDPCEVLLLRPMSGPTKRLIEAMVGTGASTDGTCVRIEEINKQRVEACGATSILTNVLAGKESSAGGAGEAAQQRLSVLTELPELSQEAAAAVALHLQQHGQQEVLAHHSSIRSLGSSSEMSLSPNALRQLEVAQGSDGDFSGSLLELLDRCNTPMGHRLMHHWVTHPLKDAQKIQERLEAVEELVNASKTGSALNNITKSLRRLPDVERGVTRALHRTASPNEVLGTLSALASVIESLSHCACVDSATCPEEEWPTSALLRQLLLSLGGTQLSKCVQSMLNAIDHDAARENNKSALFKDMERYPDIAQHRNEMAEAEQELQDMLPSIAKKAGVSSVCYTSFQGTEYCIELPQDAHLPESWVKISSNKGKRTVTCQPKEVAKKVDERDASKERLVAAAHSAWLDFLSSFADSYAQLRQGVRAIASLDCLVALSSVALSPGYTRPSILTDETEGQIYIERGRHPVLESSMSEGSYVPNSTLLKSDGQRSEIITGPNMGGKSCYMRQVALICIMAQIGSFVPAESVKMSAVDCIFTRMGAADSLALGTSTFLEEMSEASRIACHATHRSLVILDELGRGTAALDGQAIADAFLSFLISSTNCICLFATHYQAVARQILQQYPEEAVGRHASYMESENGVHFLYALSNGVADSSFGLNAARMAGLPETVLERAKEKASEVQRSAEEKFVVHQSQKVIDSIDSDDIGELKASWEAVRS